MEIFETRKLQEGLKVAAALMVSTSEILLLLPENPVCPLDSVFAASVCVSKRPQRTGQKQAAAKEERKGRGKAEKREPSEVRPTPTRHLALSHSAVQRTAQQPVFTSQKGLSVSVAFPDCIRLLSLLAP
ncbi:hypothetical protein HPP92_003808 [Vanilla planifolia]|uniref:Uncharacterized protein n=1 Tax=Vanilla planifolia TaxID=51239 RepID=A0A835S4D3_VANPL|nr:hypothetical protein HPP92_004215 [Vanilla planifolia]KAG0503736.1 hypothetical protein HPP92_003808 [Vanilla planifolia]